MATTVTTAVLGWWGAKKFHIGQNQDKLVETLQGLLKAQEMRLVQLENETKRQRERIRELEEKVKELQQVIVDQAKELERLHNKQADCG